MSGTRHSLTVLLLAGPILASSGLLEEPRAISDTVFEAADQIYNEAGASTTVRYSIVQSGLSAGTVGDGTSISGDPFFRDADGPDDRMGTLDDDLRLSELSPGVDAGRDDLVVRDRFDLDRDGDVAESVPVDHAGLARRTGSSVDLGAYEFGSDTGVAVEPSREVPGDRVQLSAYPVPAMGRLRIRTVAGRATPATVVLNDVLGRSVRRVYEGALGPGAREFEVDTRGLASGVYVVVVVTDRGRTTQGVVVVDE